MSKASILIVEDKFIVGEDIARALRNLGYIVSDVITSGEEVLEAAKKHQPDLVLMDIRLKGAIDGIEAASLLNRNYAIPVIYLTAHSDEHTLARAAETNPLGYILKPFEERQLYSAIEMALNHQRVIRQKYIADHKDIIAPHRLDVEKGVTAHKAEAFSHIIGEHPLMVDLFDKVTLVAKTDVAVHIYGENGTGKECIADALHQLSARHDKKFIKINCSAIPATLLESALFGHVKGSFTGAAKDQEGFVELAEGGTLFLDEVGDTSLDIQVKLLRLLQSGEYSRVGEAKISKSNIRIITATNKILKELVVAGKIREDFYYRINVFPLVVPPLRDRRSDIIPLAHYFRRIYTRLFNKNITGFTEAALNALHRYRWPGNVRELENVMKYAFVVARGEVIEVTDLPLDVISESTTTVLDSSLRNAKAYEVVRSPENEKELISRALQETNYNKAKAAKLLGYSRVTLWKKMTKLGLTKSAEEEGAEVVS